MNIRIYYKIYFRRTGISMSTFLHGIVTLEEAVRKFEDNGLIGYDLNEIRHFIAEDLKARKAKSIPKKQTRTPQKKPRAPRPRAKRKTKSRKSSVREDSEEKKEDDSSYFETWKVPYVEP